MVISVRFRFKKLFLYSSFCITLLLLVSKSVLQRNSFGETPLLPTEASHHVHYPQITLPLFSDWSARPCQVSNPPMLLVIVHSPPSHLLHRKAIRQTWSKNTRTIFVVGRSKVPKLQHRIIQESKQHGDIVGLEMIDSYNNLTLKHLSGLRWVQEHCPGASYILKADDDAFVNVPRAMKIIQSAFSGGLSHNVIACRVVPQGSTPRRSGKWMVTVEDYPSGEYPEYCSGLAYFARTSTLSSMYKAAVSGRVPYLWIDDVFVTGMSAQVAGVRRLDLAVWFARTDDVVVKWMRDSDGKHPLPWIVAEMTPRHWPSDAVALWKKVLAADIVSNVD